MQRNAFWNADSYQVNIAQKDDLTGLHLPGTLPFNRWGWRTSGCDPLVKWCIHMPFKQGFLRIWGLDGRGISICLSWEQKNLGLISQNVFTGRKALLMHCHMQCRWWLLVHKTGKCQSPFKDYIRNLSSNTGQLLFCKNVLQQLHNI